MKIGVLKAFKDRLTKERRKPGQLIEVSEERANELIAGGWATEVIEPKEKKEPKKKREKKEIEKP